MSMEGQEPLISDLKSLIPSSLPESRKELQDNEGFNRGDEDDEPQLSLQVDPLIALGASLDGLSPKQEKFLVAKLHGVSDAKAARAIGLTPGTVYEWKKKEPFKTAYDKIISSPVETAAEMTAFALAKAMSRLADMLDDNRIVVRQYAIDTLIRVTGADNKTKKVEVKHEYTREDVERFQREVSGS